MFTLKVTDRLTDLLHNSNLAWLLPNLRQDFQIWNNLNDPVYFEKFTELKPKGTIFTANDFIPGRLALIALEQTDAVDTNPESLLDDIDTQVVQTALERFNDQTIFHINELDLKTTGLIALASAYMYRTSGSWNTLLDKIKENPSDQWLSVITCLYGYVDEKAGLLTSLVHPGGSPIHLTTAIHTVLSNPLLPNDQVTLLLGMCQNEYGDFLPAFQRLLLVQTLFERSPQIAIEFCQKWLEGSPLILKQKIK